MSDPPVKPTPEIPDWVMQLGAVPLPTLGGKQMWGDVFLYGGWRIQRNIVTKLFRLLDPRDIRHAAGDWDHCHTAFVRLRGERAISLRSNHLVLLIHGYFRSKDSFGPMTKALRDAGFEAHAINYPSTRQGLVEHADQIELILDRVQGADTVSFVTHSMGGIVARVLLAREDSPWRKRIQVNRLVTIATPHRGSEIAQHVVQIPGANDIIGPSMGELTREQSELIPAPKVKFGCVAGARGDSRGFNPLIEGDDDVTVSVHSALHDDAEDTLVVVNAVHTIAMIHPIVIPATIRYLRTGRFRDPDAEE